MIVYTENPKQFTIITEFTKVAEYKIQPYFDTLTVNRWNLKLKTHLQSIYHNITI